MFWGTGFQSITDAFRRSAHSVRCLEQKRNDPFYLRMERTKLSAEDSMGQVAGIRWSCPILTEPFHPYLLKEKPQSKSNGQFLCVGKLFNLTPCFVVCPGPRRSRRAGRAQHCLGHHLTLSICLWQLALCWQWSCLSAVPKAQRCTYILITLENTWRGTETRTENPKWYIFGENLCVICFADLEHLLFEERKKKPKQNNSTYFFNKRNYSLGFIMPFIVFLFDNQKPGGCIKILVLSF